MRQLKRNGGRPIKFELYNNYLINICGSLIEDPKCDEKMWVSCGIHHF